MKFPESKLVARASFGLGRALRQLEKYAVAEAMLVKAQDDLGRQVKNRAGGLLAGLIQLELGKALQGRNENEQAARHFMRVAILYEPQNASGPVDLCAEALLLAGRCFATLEQWDKAIGRVQELLEHPLYKKTSFAAPARKAMKNYRRGAETKTEKP